MVSFDSANGPSATVRPFLPETIFPSFCNGWPPAHFPSCFNRSNQSYQSVTTFWRCSGERLLSQLVPRNSSRYSDFSVDVLMLDGWMMVFVSIQHYDERAVPVRTAFVMVAGVPPSGRRLDQLFLDTLEDRTFLEHGPDLDRDAVVQRRVRFRD